MTSAFHSIPPEVLDRVFSFITCQGACAQVCRSWNAWCLPRIWRIVEVGPLLNLLAPLTRKCTGNQIQYYVRHCPTLSLHYSDLVIQQTFCRDIEPSDWDRFQHYASYVHELDFPDHNSQSKRNQPSHEAFRTLALSCPTLGGHLLPNLRVLRWWSASAKLLSCATPFLSASLQSLHVTISLVDLSEELLTLVRYARRRCQLVSVYFNSPSTRIGIFEDPDAPLMAEATPGFEYLQEVTVNRMSLSGRTLQGLSCLPQLKSFKLIPIRDSADEMDTSFSSVTFEPSAFPSLEELSLDMDMDDIGPFLDQPCFADKLKILDLSSDYDVGKLSSLVEALKSHKNVHTLRICAFTFWAEEEEETGDPLRINDLYPLTELRSLRKLELLLQYPLDLAEEDYGLLASRLPLIEELWLGELDRIFDRNSSEMVSMNVLQAFVSPLLLLIPASP